MTLLLFIVFGILGIAACAYFEEAAGMCFLFSFIFLVASIVLAYDIYKCEHVIPKKIAIYAEENAEIEEKVANTVAKYMEYERDIIIEIAPDDDAMTLVSLYPDLKSDQLISAEIEVYIKNNDKIKQLKDTQANVSVYRWFLNFGIFRR